jgi:Na+-transporting methylmalonyl-CoA/oxaloacetate decarboxylase beta subunit
MLSGVLSEPQFEMLSVFVVAGVLLVGIPTAGIYRDARRHSPRPFAWTAGMGVAAAVVPLLGALGVWALYTAVEVRGEPTSSAPSSP